MRYLTNREEAKAIDTYSIREIRIPSLALMERAARCLTEELEAEGWAADVIRGLQDARKASGFEVSDRITTTLSVPAAKEEWANRHADHIAAETLSTSFTVTTDAVSDGHDIVDGVTATVQKKG